MSTFIGEMTAYGGRSDSEPGGSGTLVAAQEVESNLITTLTVNNQGSRPVSTYLSGIYTFQWKQNMEICYNCFICLFINLSFINGLKFIFVIHINSVSN